MHVTMHMVNNGMLDDIKLRDWHIKLNMLKTSIRKKIRAYEENYYETNASCI